MLAAFVFAVLGAIAGSFAGAVSERLYTGQSWFSGRSACDACGTQLAPRDLVPIISWLFSGGRCRFCGAVLSPRYLIVESIAAAIFVFSYRTIGLSLALPFLLVALTLLFIIVLYDLRHTIIPYGLSALLGAVSFIYFVLTVENGEQAGLTLFLGGLFALAFLALHVFSRGRAMGLGDAPLVLFLSLLAEGQAFAGLLFSFWIGAVIGIVILVRAPRGARIGIEVPFAPFLAAGFLLALFIPWNPLIWLAS